MRTATIEQVEMTAPADAKGESPFGRAAAAALMTTAGEILRCFLRHARARRDMRRLEELDERMLRDIGITRSEIASVIYGRPNSEGRSDAND